MKRLFLILTVASLLIYPGMALAQAKGKTQAEKRSCSLYVIKR
jgi:hypothetical protein